MGDGVGVMGGRGDGGEGMGWEMGGEVTLSLADIQHCGATATCRYGVSPSVRIGLGLHV